MSYYQRDESRFVEQLKRELDEARDIIFSQNESLNTGLLPNGFGQPTSGVGSERGIRTYDPHIVDITDVDDAGSSTTIFDKIDIVGTTMIVQHSSSPFDLRWIQKTPTNGTYVTLTPKNGQVMVLKTGGNLDITSDITVADNEMIIAQFFDDSDITANGGYKVTKTATGSGDNLGNHIATQNLVPDVNSTHNLGISGKQWNTLWIDTLDNASTIVINSPNFAINSASITLGDAGTDVVTVLGNEFNPALDSTTSLGKTAKAFANVWVDTIRNDTATTIASPITSITSTTINLGDAGSDTVNVLANKILPALDSTTQIGETAKAMKEVWVDTILNDTATTIASPITTITSATINLGDAGTDTINILGNNVLPALDATTQLGATAKAFKEIWVDTITNDATVAIASPITTITSATINLGDAGSDQVNILANKVLPAVDATTQLGETNKAWKEVWVDTIRNDAATTIASPTTTISSATINFGDAAGDNINVLGQIATGIVIEEIVAPSTPPANTLVLYGKLDGSFTKLFYKQEDGTEIGPLGAGGGGGVSLSDNNTWTGINTFTGTTHSINSATINLGDATSDNINVNGRINTDLDPSGDGTLDLGSSALEWGAIFVQVINATAATSVASPTFSILSSTINFGDATTDNINFLGRVNSNIDPSTDGGKNLGTSALEWGTMFVRTLNATATLAVASPIFSINSGTINLGDAATDDINVLGTIQTNVLINGGLRIRSDDATEIGYFVKNATSALGSAGSMQMPVITSLTPTVANLDSAFGSEIGCFGLYNTASSSVVLAIKNQASEWIVIACGDASATVISDHIN